MTTPCFRPRPCLCVMFWTRFLHPITITDPSTHLTAVPVLQYWRYHVFCSTPWYQCKSWYDDHDHTDGGCGCSSTCKVSHLIMIPPSDLWRWAVLTSPRPVIWLLQQHKITNSAAAQPSTSPHFSAILLPSPLMVRTGSGFFSAAISHNQPTSIKADRKSFLKR